MKKKLKRFNTPFHPTLLKTPGGGMKTKCFNTPFHPTLLTPPPQGGGMKTKCFNNNEFAKNIEEMLTNPVTYKKLKDEALDLINTEWEWTARSKVIFDQIFSNPVVSEKS